MNKEQIIALFHKHRGSAYRDCTGEVVYSCSESELLAFAKAIQDKQRQEDAKQFAKLMNPIDAIKNKD